MNFVFACREGNLEKVKKMFNEEKIDIHYDEERPFRSACAYGHLEIVKWLFEISNGSIDIHIQDETPFCFACKNGHLEVARWLFGFGNINIHADNEYAFRFTCENGHFEVVKWLFEFGDINIHACDEDAFHSACKNGHFEVAQWLLSFYTKKELINLNHFLTKKKHNARGVLVEEEIEKRKRSYINLILFLFEKKYKLLDINAIAMVWKDYI